MRKRTEKSKKLLSIGGPLTKMAGGGELAKLDFSKGAKEGRGSLPGMCVAGVIYTAEANGGNLGAPEVAGGVDPPNHPRGLMAWANRKGWGSIPGTKGRGRTIKGAFGNFNVKSMSHDEWADAVIGGLIPSGSLIFSTRKGWDASTGSSGNDAAIAQDGGKKLWSGHWQSQDTKNGKTFGTVYGSPTTEVVALTHPGGNSAGYDGDSSDDSGSSGSSGSSGGGGSSGGEASAKPSMVGEDDLKYLYTAVTGKTSSSTSQSDKIANNIDASILNVPAISSQLTAVQKENIVTSALGKKVSTDVNFVQSPSSTIAGVNQMTDAPSLGNTLPVDGIWATYKTNL